MASKRRRELIREALGLRLRELCDSTIAGLSPQEFGPHAALLTELQAQAEAARRETEASRREPGMPGLRAATALKDWAAYDGDCLEALAGLSLGKELPARPGAHPPIEPFISRLHAARLNPEERFRLLAERYACPLNIALDSEVGVREHLLERLMVQDRARIERGEIEAAGERDLLLKLNLVAVYAAQGEDLRYLDALNYYYELRPATWKHQGIASGLLISYLGLYARALSEWLEQKLSE